MKNCWSVYLLLCSNKALYAGITKDVQKRLAVHNSGKGSKYVRAHLPAELLSARSGFTHSQALRLERLLKNQNRTYKLALLHSWVPDN